MKKLLLIVTLLVSALALNISFASEVTPEGIEVIAPCPINGLHEGELEGDVTITCNDGTFYHGGTSWIAYVYECEHCHQWLFAKRRHDDSRGIGHYFTRSTPPEKAGAAFISFSISKDDIFYTDESYHDLGWFMRFPY